MRMENTCASRNTWRISKSLFPFLNWNLKSHATEEKRVEVRRNGFFHSRSFPFLTWNPMREHERSRFTEKFMILKQNRVIFKWKTLSCDFTRGSSCATSFLWGGNFPILGGNSAIMLSQVLMTAINLGFGKCVRGNVNQPSAETFSVCLAVHVQRCRANLTFPSDPQRVCGEVQLFVSESYISLTGRQTCGDATQTQGQHADSDWKCVSHETLRSVVSPTLPTSLSQKSSQSGLNVITQLLLHFDLSTLQRNRADVIFIAWCAHLNVHLNIIKQERPRTLSPDIKSGVDTSRGEQREEDGVHNRN